MPQSFACVHLHVISSTKARRPLITKELASGLYAYMGGVAENEKCVLVSAGGMPDHVHLLVSISREIAIAHLVRSVKGNSSRWLHEQGHGELWWQAGYAAFAVSLSLVSTVKAYIVNQEEHHRGQT
jgi:REP element-mobilizing transposase RayT